jgi:hypothetical protein
MKAMARHRSHSIEFKRQVAQEFVGGETLYAFARRHDISRTLMRVIYYHVELDDHSLILAENTPAETLIDNVDRMAFDNWAEYMALYPDGKPIVEMSYPRAKPSRQVQERSVSDWLNVPRPFVGRIP